MKPKKKKEKLSPIIKLGVDSKGDAVYKRRNGQDFFPAHMKAKWRPNKKEREQMKAELEAFEKEAAKKQLPSQPTKKKTVKDYLKGAFSK